MNLDETQKQQVAGWIAAGVKMADIQTRLAKEFSVHLTYMEVRFLMDDLKLVPKSVEEPKPAAALINSTPAPAAPVPPPTLPSADAAPAVAGKVAVNVDAVTRPGTMISGKVTFTDGQTAEWYLDEMGRLGLATAQKGYRPPAADVETFQIELQSQLAKLGF